MKQPLHERFQQLAGIRPLYEVQLTSPILESTRDKLKNQLTSVSANVDGITSKVVNSKQYKKLEGAIKNELSTGEKTGAIISKVNGAIVKIVKVIGNATLGTKAKRKTVQSILNDVIKYVGGFKAVMALLKTVGDYAQQMISVPKNVASNAMDGVQNFFSFIPGIDRVSEPPAPTSIDVDIAGNFAEVGDFLGYIVALKLMVAIIGNIYNYQQRNDPKPEKKGSKLANLFRRKKTNEDQLRENKLIDDGEAEALASLLQNPE